MSHSAKMNDVERETHNESTQTRFDEILEYHKFFGDVYKSIEKLDCVGAVLGMMKGLLDTTAMPDIIQPKKNPDKARKYCMLGSSYFQKKNYNSALECYNKALLFVPRGTSLEAYIYSKRSKLFFKVKEYQVAMNNIKTYDGVKIVSGSKRKVYKMINQCDNKMQGDIAESDFVKNFFKLNFTAHSQIPCLSGDVDVISKSGEKQIVAAKDISVGSIIALEPAYVSYSPRTKAYLTCYYCQKMTLNLIPCEHCCYALFCNKTCKELCVKEYHLIECKIIHALEEISKDEQFRLSVKMVLKLKAQCKTWSILIEESQNDGPSRFRTGSLNQVYDVNNYSSVLSYEEIKYSLATNGRLFHASVACAKLIYYLQKVKNFFPKPPHEKLTAIKCVAKLFVSFCVMWPWNTEIRDTVRIRRIIQTKPETSDQSSHQKNTHEITPPHYGRYSFTSKLKHACDPNLMVVGMNNKIALIAIKPIKEMTELTLSHIDHWCQYHHVNRQMKMFKTINQTCSCRVCEENWGSSNFIKSDLDHSLLKGYESWKFLAKKPERYQKSLFYELSCMTLSALKEQQNTAEYKTVYTEFRKQLNLCRHSVTKNIKLDGPYLSDIGSALSRSLPSLQSYADDLIEVVI